MEKEGSERERNRSQSVVFCFMQRGGRVSSGQRGEYPSTSPPRSFSSSHFSLRDSLLFHHTLPPSSSSFSSSSSSSLLSHSFVGWQALASFLTHFNGYLPNHVFYCRKFQHTTLREPKECSILSSAPLSARVCWACQCVYVCVRARVCVCVCVWVCEWVSGVRRGGGELEWR